MINKYRVVFVIGAVFGLLSCSSDDSDSDSGPSGPCADACRSIDSRCGTNDFEGCTNLFCDLMIPPSGCFDALDSASCEQIQGSSGGWMDTCFPPCGTRDATCSGDTITQCTDKIDGSLRSMTSACSSVCAINGGAYSGACSDSYNGQPSSTGYDVCWCQQ